MQDESYYYCTKCGHVVYTWIDSSGKCFYCGSSMERLDNYTVPGKNKTLAPSMIFDEYIRDHPNFSQEACDNRKAIEERFASQLKVTDKRYTIDSSMVGKADRAMKSALKNHRYTCPMCGSANIKSTAINNLLGKNKLQGKRICAACRFVW